MKDKKDVADSDERFLAIERLKISEEMMKVLSKENQIMRAVEPYNRHDVLQKEPDVEISGFDSRRSDPSNHVVKMLVASNLAIAT